MEISCVACKTDIRRTSPPGFVALPHLLWELVDTIAGAVLNAKNVYGRTIGITNHALIHHWTDAVVFNVAPSRLLELVIQNGFKPRHNMRARNEAFKLITIHFRVRSAIKLTQY